MSDGGGVQDQARDKQIKDTRAWLVKLASVTEPTYKRPDLSSIWKITEPLETSPLITKFLNVTLQALPNHTSCWICLPLQKQVYIEIPVPSGWNLSTPAPNSNKTSLVGPVAYNVHLALTSHLNVTCITNTGGNEILGFIPGELCTNNQILPINASVTCSLDCIFFRRGDTVCLCLPSNWTGTCTQVFLTPDVSIFETQQLEAALSPYPNTQKKWALLASILIRGEIAAEIGAGVSGLGTSLSIYHKLCQELNEDMEWVADSLMSLQNQLNSLAAVTLQNRRALDLLTAEKGGTCLFLGEEWCYYVNQTGVVTTKVRELRERSQKKKQRIRTNMGFQLRTMDPMVTATGWTTDNYSPPCHYRPILTKHNYKIHRNNCNSKDSSPHNGLTY